MLPSDRSPGSAFFKRHASTKISSIVTSTCRCCDCGASSDWIRARRVSLRQCVASAMIYYVTTVMPRPKSETPPQYADLRLASKQQSTGGLKAVSGDRRASKGLWRFSASSAFSAKFRTLISANGRGPHEYPHCWVTFGLCVEAVLQRLGDSDLGRKNGIGPRDVELGGGALRLDWRLRADNQCAGSGRGSDWRRRAHHADLCCRRRSP